MDDLLKTIQRLLLIRMHAVTDVLRALRSFVGSRRSTATRALVAQR